MSEVKSFDQCLCLEDTAKGPGQPTNQQGVHELCAGCVCPLHRDEVQWVGQDRESTNELPTGLKVVDFKRLHGYWEFKIVRGKKRLVERYLPVAYDFPGSQGHTENMARALAVDELLRISNRESLFMPRPWLNPERSPEDEAKDREDLGLPALVDLEDIEQELLEDLDRSGSPRRPANDKILSFPQEVQKTGQIPARGSSRGSLER